ncbi:MAG: AMP-binding protein [Acidimicrobiales bacterium]|nr:AMP-binding protein [Acidimicrobiales bacterium]
MKLTESYWPAEPSITIEESTVGSALRAAAEQHGPRPAMAEGTPGRPEDRRRWSFDELVADAERVAGALLERFEPGERVAVWAPNLPEWVLLELGAGLAGVVLVTVNPAYQARELEYVLRQSGASGIFLVPEFRGNPMAASLEAVRPSLPALRESVSFEDWDALLATSPANPKLPDVRPSDPAQIQYTSGTTGFPKGALLHHRGLTNNARIFATLTDVRPGDTCLNPFPMFHTAGCVLGVLGTLQAGACHIPVYAFDPSLMLELAETERADIILGVPTVLLALLECPDLATRDLSRVRVALSGGATVPAELVKRVEASFGVQFSIVYGTTECSPLLTQVRLDDDFVDKTETLGRPVPQTEIKITDPETGKIVPCGEAGELCARGYCVMTGYYDMPDQTAAAIDDEGWYHTGDLASMDDRGFLRIEGRLKDMIIRGGENIYPREIEDLLFEHPKVADVAVVGVPDERWGEAVAAFVRPAPGEAPTEQELFDHCRAHLSPQKTPRHWRFLNEFPLTASGKIQKFVLRDQFMG